MSQYSNFIEQMSLEQQSSIQSYELQNQKVWLKKASPRHATWIYLPLHWISKCLGLNMFAPVPNYGGKQAIDCEVKRIQQLHRLGIQVPEILAYNDSAVLLKDAAQAGQQIEQLEYALKKSQPSASRLSLYADAICAIQHIHDLDCYLSEAFARNILVDNQHQFTYIDFETDPKQRLSLQDCQTRDWLFFMFSTACHFNEDEIQSASTLLIENISKNKAIYHDICRVGRKLQWILKLKLEKLGGDGRRLRKGLLLLQLINQKNNRVKN
ncbi:MULTISPECIES: serine/threonine protein kinase [unclassified Acinetobacter]|uniref:serine/threonine protein kinase n=1 Tax=unclassified Acinetobacter TaxID=196816 RepID=UPI00293495C6|nr:MULTISPECIES: serine/threonine protein kinase [unclassified Acinetobacter]WOE32873.1 serine/threonine protein kinase [Acinetobacter sp. SAAs470]WOE38350.1 serine/threonine protein kinase [Acinetobacter sp. SAAs474]